jgi:hypothetical protein
MSVGLRQYLVDAYVGHADGSVPKVKKNFPIQIDDQDDNDRLDSFCNVFVTVDKKNFFEVELTGRLPITTDMADFAEIYDGSSNARTGRLALRLNPQKIDALSHLADLIRATTLMGETVGNPLWDRISARTISSLRRFVRVIKQFRRA